MATGRKGSTSKGAVRFPDDEAPPGSPTRRDEDSHLCSLVALREKDNSYLVKAGFLKSHCVYELVFLVPDVPSVGKDLSCSSTASPSRRAPHLRIQRVSSTLEGGVKVTCEYKAHQEGVLQEELTIVAKGKSNSSLKVKLQAKIIDPHHGTPMLMEGVKCLGPVKDCHSKHCNRRI
ncbi:unnamed protein product [Knipowitschia caucasica]